MYYELKNVKDKELFAYGVYQIEANGRSLFSQIEGNEDSIMGLPVRQIKDYLKNLKNFKTFRNTWKQKILERMALIRIATIGFLPKKSQFFGISALLHEKLQS